MQCGQHRAPWIDEEVNRLKLRVGKYGTDWAKVARGLPGRTPQACMRKWQNRRNPSQKEKAALMKTTIVKASAGPTDSRCRVAAVAGTPWSPEQDAALVAARKRGVGLEVISTRIFGGQRTRDACARRLYKLSQDQVSARASVSSRSSDSSETRSTTFGDEHEEVDQLEDNEEEDESNLDRDSSEDEDMDDEDDEGKSKGWMRRQEGRELKRQRFEASPELGVPRKRIPSTELGTTKRELKKTCNNILVLQDAHRNPNNPGKLKKALGVATEIQGQLVEETSKLSL